MHLLEKRGLAVSVTDRSRITGCTDLDTLDRWFDRAITVTDASELFLDG